jgi:hypothetical protein
MATREYPQGWKEFRIRYLSILKNHEFRCQLAGVSLNNSSTNPYNTSSLLHTIGAANVNRRQAGTPENQLAYDMVKDYADLIVDFYRDYVGVELTYEIYLNESKCRAWFDLVDKELEDKIFELYNKFSIIPTARHFGYFNFATIRRAYQPLFSVLYALRTNKKGYAVPFSSCRIRSTIPLYKAFLKQFDDRMSSLSYYSNHPIDWNVYKKIPPQ